MRHFVRAAGLVLAVLLAPAAGHASVNVFFESSGGGPGDTLVVDPGAVLQVHLAIEAPGVEFNAFDATVGYDTLRFDLTAHGEPPSNDILGGCSTIEFPSDAPGRFSIARSHLGATCARATGYGRLYTLYLRAGQVPGMTTLRFEAVRVVNAGNPLPGVVSFDAVVWIGSGAAVGDLPVARPLHVAPNPFTASTRLDFTLAAPGPVSVRVYGATGALIRTLLAPEDRSAGSHSVAWDGRDDTGRRVGPGVYFLRLLTPVEARSTRVVRLER